MPSGSDPCVLCGHAPHADSSPVNPAGCTVITNEFRRTTCNCPEYRKPGVAPRAPKRHITMDTWPTCALGLHHVDTLEEVDDGEGNVTITARCCGREDQLVVPRGGRLVRGILGLRVMGGIPQQPAAQPPAPLYPAKGPFSNAKKQPESPKVETASDGIHGRFGLLEIDD